MQRLLPPPDNSLFEARFRLQREASEAAGRYIPLVVENVVGAQRWVGRAAWHHGSYYLWGDVPALMLFTLREIKREGRNFHAFENGLGSNQSESDAVKQHGSGAAWFDKALDERRKAASARSQGRRGLVRYLRGRESGGNDFPHARYRKEQRARARLHLP